MNDTVSFLSDLIRFPSTSGNEMEVVEFIARAFETVADEVSLVPIPPGIVDDPDYSSPVPGLSYEGRFNLRAVVRGSGGGRALIVNTHADVVPPSDGQVSPFTPIWKDGFIHGRGACDAKGQIATIWHVLKSLRDEGVRLRGDLIIHIVVEEEVGGNGTLAMVRTGELADSVLVLEPTGLEIMTSSRGAVWFRITTRGRPGHVGSGQASVSALKSAVAVTSILEAYHDNLLSQSKGIPLFDAFEDPMPITFGKLHSGNWPATVPGEAILEGVLGFLPTRTKEQVMAEMREAIGQQGDAWLRKKSELDFTYRHDCHVTPADAEVVAIMKKVVERVGGDAIISAFPASCDAWLYSNQLGLPTIIFGPGRLADAHSNHEKISLDDIETASDVIKSFVLEWSGSRSL